MTALELLREEARARRAELEAIEQAIAILEGRSLATTGKRRGRPPKAAAAVQPALLTPQSRRKRRTTTPEQRAAQSARMKAYHANKKAKREAAEAIQRANAPAGPQSDGRRPRLVKQPPEARP